MGQKIIKESEQQLAILQDSAATLFLAGLGQRLAANAPGGSPYRFQFKIVNDRTINAFALPGGFIYIHRGTFEAAANEAQLASVIAHEIGHVVLRHGAHQISSAYTLQSPVSTLGAIGRTSVSSVLERIEGGFTANSALLKNSRESEREADLMGTQIMVDSGYDPRAVAQFFQTLEAQAKSVSTTRFFSEHPSPANRSANVNREIEKMGGVPRSAVLDSPEFQDVKRAVSSLPQPARP